MLLRSREVLHAVHAAVPTWSSTVSSGRTVDSVFAGMHRSARLGPGEQWADAREYQTGDDVRRIDWAATARTGSVLVRDTNADRGLRVTMIVDCTPSMQFGTTTLSKSELALGAAAALALSCSRQGDSVAAMLVAASACTWVPPGSGIDHVNVLMRRLESSFSSSGEGSFVPGIARAAAFSSTGGMVVAISDFLDPGATSALRRLSHSHRTVALVIEDPRELELPAVGTIELLDPESGELFVLDTDDAALRHRFAERAAARRSQRKAELVAAGAEVRYLGCGEHWLRDLGRLFTSGFFSGGVR
jgi:uncharacterized protein (DUF58 family)